MKTGIRGRGENETRWQERVRLAEAYPGGVSSYCRRAGVSVEALRYWRKKSGAALATASAVRVSPPVFLPIQVMEAVAPARVQALPDAKWVADVILHLSAGRAGSQS